MAIASLAQFSGQQSPASGVAMSQPRSAARGRVEVPVGAEVLSHVIVSRLRRCDAAELAVERGATPEIVRLVERAAGPPSGRAVTSPISSGSFTLASAAMPIVAIAASAPSSFFSVLASRRPPLVPLRGSTISVPQSIFGIGSALFVGEGQPIKTVSAIAEQSLQVKKAAVIIALTEEAVRAAPDLPQLITSTVATMLGTSIDGAMFTSDAGTAAAPPGLGYNLPPEQVINGAATTTADAITDDLASLLAAVQASQPVLAVPAAAAGYLAKLGGVQSGPRTWLPCGVEVIASSGVADGDAWLLDVAAIGWAGSEEVEVGFTIEAIVHESTEPAAIVGDDGTPAIGDVASPVRSAFQTNCIFLRPIAWLDWKLLRADGLAKLEGAAWCQPPGVGA